MKTLHEIALYEQLVAQGAYQYQLVGKASGLKEYWSLHQTADEGFTHRAEVYGKTAAIQVKQISHLNLTPDYRPQRLEMYQRIADNESSTTIICYEQAIVQTIKIDGKTTETTMEVPPHYNLFFPPVSAHGFILRHYDFQIGGRQALPMVNVRIQPENGLALSVETRLTEYEYLNDEEIETPAGQFACRHFIRHDQSMQQHLWQDKAGLVIHWSVPYSQIMKWEYLLVNYQRA